MQRPAACTTRRSPSGWSRSDLAGQRVLILGYGSIGRAVEARLAPFGVRIDRVAGRAREALRAGLLRAALDVTDPKSLPEGHGLLTAPGCMITPHVAGRTAAFPANGYRLARAQLGPYLRGEPLANVVRAPMDGAAAAA